MLSFTPLALLQHKDIQHRSWPFRHSVSSVRLTQSLEASGRHRFRRSMSDTWDCQAKGTSHHQHPIFARAWNVHPTGNYINSNKKRRVKLGEPGKYCDWKLILRFGMPSGASSLDWQNKSHQSKQIKLGCLDIGQHRKSNQQQKIVPSL